MDLIIRNATIISPLETIKADIGVKNGKIAILGDLSEFSAIDEYDAEGKIVMPGVVDVHTHINHFGGYSKTNDDFFTGSRAAACGGVTTFVDFAMQKKGEDVWDSINNRRAEADGEVCIDYSLHANFTDMNTNPMDEIEKIVEAGYPSFKLFMTFKKAAFMVEDSMLYASMERAYKAGGIIGIHAENDEICSFLTSKNLSEGKSTPIYHAESRPNIAEAECVSKATLFSNYTNSALYIFHLTTKESAEMIRQAKIEGKKIFAETCPHYLVLDKHVYAREDGQNFIMTPPLREQEDIEALWKAIDDGTISIVSSDHCCYDSEQKLPAKDDFTNTSPGISGTETLLPIMYQQGVNAGRITINKLVELLCYNPAKFFGMHNKGHISVGADADIVVLDPDKDVILDGNKLNMVTDYSVFDGIEVNGYPVKVFSRGKLVSSNGEFVGERGHGQFIERSKIDFSI